MPTAVLDRRAASKTTSQKEVDACALQVGARLVSLNGGVILAVCILFSAFFGATLLTERLVSGQAVLFAILTVSAWMYLVDSISERLSLNGMSITKSSLLSRDISIKLEELEALLLVHEGLNQEVGIESVTARYRNGKTERLPLGPSWRRRELEAFLRSVEQAMGNRKLLEEVR